MVTFGQVVVGPPGSGKSTYCAGMAEIMHAMGRQVAIVNLDPANDELPYDAAVNITDLIAAHDVMEEHKLGPNGGLLFAMEYLEANYDWLLAKVRGVKSRYIIFDCPGQIELYTHQNGIRNMLQQMQKDGFQLAMVNLVDAHYCTDAGKFISVLMSCLTTMIQLELPAVNILSKIDLIESFGELDFSLDFYTEASDVKYLADLLKSDERMKKHAKLSDALCQLVEDFGLVYFQTLDIQDKDSVLQVLKVVDKAGGYMYGDVDAFRNYGSPALGPAVESDSQRHVRDVMVGCNGWGLTRYGSRVSEIQERYVTGRTKK